jgi:YesN/AraC family two-component response regulator
MFFERHGLDSTDLFQINNFRLERYPVHFHLAYEFIWVEEGMLTMSIDGQEQHFMAGESAIIFPNQLHDIQLSDQSKEHFLLFSPELVNDFHKAYKGRIPAINKVIFDEKPALDLMDNIYEKKRFLYDLCARIVKQMTFQPIDQVDRETIIYDILLYVEENHQKNINLRKLAKALKYDYSYLSRIFNQWMGMTFTEYLNHYRISNALFFLDHSEDNISNIVFKCGYNNFRTFNRNFKQIVGMSPTQYIKKMEYRE